MTSGEGGRTSTCVAHQSFTFTEDRKLWLWKLRKDVQAVVAVVCIPLSGL
ncbi:MAG: hypothetical protein Q9M89_10730 [Persephonella sp.]|nr:hypothetical protein [Persephonella sp.]